MTHLQDGIRLHDQKTFGQTDCGTTLADKLQDQVRSKEADIGRCSQRACMGITCRLAILKHEQNSCSGLRVALFRIHLLVTDSV